MSNYEQIGYVLSPATPPIVDVALLEEGAGEVSVGDLVAIPIVLENKEMYILGNVLYIETIRPLLDKSSKAPFSLARGDTMGLMEDVDMLTLADLEDLAYIAKIYLHTFYYEGKVYTPNIVIPGSKIVKPPDELLEKLFAGDVEIGTVRGSNAKIKLLASELQKSPFRIIGELELAVDIAVKIARGLSPNRIFYVGPTTLVDRPVADSEAVGSGERKVSSEHVFLNIMNNLKSGDVVIADSTLIASSLSTLASTMVAARASEGVFIEIRETLPTRPLAMRNTLILGPVPPNSRPYMPRLESLYQPDYLRKYLINGIGEGEFLLLGGTKYHIPVVGVI